MAIPLKNIGIAYHYRYPTQINTTVADYKPLRTF